MPNKPSYGFNTLDYVFIIYSPFSFLIRLIILVLISFLTPFFLLFSFITSRLLHYIRTIAIPVSFIIPTAIITLVHHLFPPIYIYNTYNFSLAFLLLCVFSMRGNTSGNWCISHNVRIYCNAFLLYYSLLFLLNYQFIYDKLPSNINGKHIRNTRTISFTIHRFI